MLWLLAVFLFGISFIIIGVVSSYALSDLLRAELGAVLDPLIIETINLGFLEFEILLGMVLFAVGCLGGVIISLASILSAPKDK